jgi:hypothetical protein
MTNLQTRRWLQALLLIAILAAAVRLIFVMRERRQPGVANSAPAPTASLNREAYVVPKKLHPYDLKSAQQLTQQPVWVKEGYRYTCYSYDPRSHRADLQHEAGLLGPIEQVRITDVVAQPSPGGARQHQVLAIFNKDGKSYAVPVGTRTGNEYRFYSDEMFFHEDPRQLYSFWPEQVWQDINAHRVTPGMNEIQADFAVGMGVPQPGGNPEQKVVQYPNGGHPLTVTYQDGKAVSVK